MPCLVVEEVEYSAAKLDQGRGQGADRPLKYSPSFINALIPGRCSANTW